MRNSIYKMKNKRIGGKGQVFSIDVLFSLLPIVMIMGASLQYVFLAEEQMINSELGYQLDTSAQLMADYVVSKINSRDEASCHDISSYLDSYDSLFLGGNAGYSLRMQSQYGTDRFCRGVDLDNTAQGVSVISLTAMSASQVRFVVNHDADDKVIPGEIVSLHFMRWEDQG